MSKRKSKTPKGDTGIDVMVDFSDGDEDDDKLFEQAEAIMKAALGKNLEVSQKSAKKFRTYLLSKIVLPVRVTGGEDFPWEEKYVFGAEVRRNTRR